MKRAAFAVLLLASCSFSIPGGSAVVDDAPRGEGERPADAAEVDALDASPTVDSDGDGLFDAVDNCPALANADQRNWDLDPRGDACDPCPHLAANDADGDGDGVGDACDPRPATAGDSRALFLGFYDANDLGGWTDGNTGSTGTWTVTNGALVQSVATTAPFAGLAAPMPYQRIYVATSIEVISANASATIGVCTGWNGTLFDCCNINTTGAVPVVEAQTGTAMKMNLPWTGSVTAGTQIDIVENMLTANICKFGSVLTVQTTPTAIAGRVLFFVARAAVKYRYLFVAQIGT